MSFRLTLGRAQVKHFKTALQTLNKIGGELLIEAVPGQLVLRSINTAKSAFLSVTYFSQFFDSYEIYDTEVVQAIVLSKNSLAIFRSQKISQIELVLDNANARLQATVHTDEGLFKVFSFNCLDGEVLQANVDRDAYPTVVVAEASELEKLLSSFQHTLDEITLIANPVSVAALANGHRACELRSFVDPLRGGQEHALKTSLALDTRAVFTSYSHSSPGAADVTFNVKDFRAMTALCTALGADVALRLEAAGAPLVVEPHFRGLREGSDVDFQAMLVLSTLEESQLGPEDQAAALQQQQQGHTPLQAAAGPVPGMQAPGEPIATNAAPSGYETGAAGGGAEGGWQRGAYDGAAEVTRVSGWGGRGGGRGGGVAAAAAGRGRRRLPQPSGDTPGAVAAAGAGTVPPVPAARGAYAAAAAAEGLAAGDGGVLAAAEAAGGWAGAGVQSAGGAEYDTSMDGAEDDLPARRNHRPARFDIAHQQHHLHTFNTYTHPPASDQHPAHNGAGAATGPGAAAECGAGAGVWGGAAAHLAASGSGGGAAADETSVRHTAAAAAAAPYGTTTQQQQGFQQPAGYPAGHHHHHAHPLHPRVGQPAGPVGGRPSEQGYVQFPRAPGGAGQSAAVLTGEAGASALGGDSQDPECLPARRSPYGKHGSGQPPGNHPPSPVFGSHHNKQPGDPRRAGVAQQQQAWPGKQPLVPQPNFAAPEISAFPDPQQQQQQAPTLPLPHQQHHQQQPQPQQHVISHAELFGEDEEFNRGGGGGGDGVFVEEHDDDNDDDDDEELPATPPEEQQTRPSLGAGVLGAGHG